MSLATYGAESELERMATRLQALAEASHCFAAGVNIQTTLDHVTQVAAARLSLACVIYTRESESPWLTVAADARSATYRGAARIAIDSARPAATVTRSGRPLLLAAIGPEDAPAAAIWEPELPHSALFVPLRARGHVLGCLGLARHDPAMPALTSDDLAFAEALAASVALGLVGARLAQAAQVSHQVATATYAQLETLVRSAAIGIGYLDRNLHYIMVNPALAAINGRTPADHIGRTMHEVLPGLAARLEPLVRQVLATGEAARDIELRGSTCPIDGGVHHWLISYFPVRGSDYVIIGVGIILIDVTARKQAEQALRAREARQAFLLKLADRLGPLSDPTAILQMGAHLLGEHLRASRVFYAEFEPDGEHIVISEGYGIAGERSHLAGRYRIADHSSYVLRELGPSRALAVADTQRELDRADLERDQSFEARAFIACPMLTAGRLAAALGVTQATPREWTDDEVELACETAERTWAAVKRARAEAAMRNAERNLGALFAHLPVGISILNAVGDVAYVNPALEQILRLDRDSLLGGAHRARRYLRPDGTLMPFDELASTLAARTQRVVSNVETGVVTEQGEQIWMHVSAAPIDFPDWRTVVVGTDITAHKAADAQVQAALRAEQAARLAAEAAEARAARLQAITADLAGALTREQVIAVITGRSQAATGAAGVMVSLLSPDEQRLTLAGWSGHSREELVSARVISIGAHMPASVAVREQTPLWLHARAEAEERFPGIGAQMADGAPHAIAALPLLAGARLVGAICFSYAAPQAFMPEEQAFMRALAQQCAQALERARLYAELIETRERLQLLGARLVDVQEEERRHLARELHDEIGQALTGLNLMLSTAHSLPPEKMHDQLGRACQQISHLTSLVRQRALDLRPAILDDMGLLAALTWFLARYSEQTSIQLDVQLQGIARRFSPVVELTAYRIVQEALTNVARHADVLQAAIAVWLADDELLINVVDAGRGFMGEAAWHAHRSSGLVGMRERAVLLGGDLKIIATPGAGTNLLAILPIAGGDAAVQEVL